jgi:hypothetical protein
VCVTEWQGLHQLPAHCHLKGFWLQGDVQIDLENNRRGNGCTVAQLQERVISVAPENGAK